MLPPPYHTTEQVRTGISLAYSNFNNPRGLEKMWNAPWLASINGLLAPYDGSFTVHSEYPMFIPSLVVKDLNLRLKFEENGLDYHDIDDGRSSDDGESEEEKEILPAVPSHQRQSLRLPIIKKIAVQREEEDKKKRKAELRKERAQLRLDQSKADKEEEDSYAENYSYESAASIPGRGAKDEEPDILVNHVATINLKEPTCQQGMDHYVHRAGKKVYHYCTSLIGELKPAPSRSLKGGNHTVAVSFGLTAAQQDLCEYCAAYFECHPKAKSVIALAAAGPFWKWALIQRLDVPKWNWIVNEAADPEDSRLADWDEKFSMDYLILGTETSDKELTKINEQHISKMLTDGHTPDVPTSLQ